MMLYPNSVDGFESITDTADDAISSEHKASFKDQLQSLSIELENMQIVIRSLIKSVTGNNCIVAMSYESTLIVSFMC